MLNFQIQSDSEIPASKQLFAQIQFAIASGQYEPGHRLPSTRQLAMITGLHRNTIAKVYQQLEETGLVESIAGSGIYVKSQGYESVHRPDSPLLQQNQLVKDSIDELLHLGCSIAQARELFLEEIDWRFRCSARVILTVPLVELSAGELMLQELKQALDISIELVTLEKLPDIIQQINFGTVVTNRYFLKEVLDVVPPQSFRVIPVDIYDYAKELAIIKDLPKQYCLGLVSPSQGILEIAESIVNSQKGNELLVLTAPVTDSQRLKGLVRNAQTIICDPASEEMVRAAIAEAREDLIRFPEIICSDNYVSAKSLTLLKQELGLDNLPE